MRRCGLVLTSTIGSPQYRLQHHSQHWQINKNDGPSPHRMVAGRHVIPAPDSGSPAEERSPEKFTTGSRNHPENKGIEEPTLRHECRKKEHPGVALAITQ